MGEYVFVDVSFDGYVFVDELHGLIGFCSQKDLTLGMFSLIFH